MNDSFPVWVVEMGKMDLHSVVRRGPDAIRDFEKYVARAARTMLNSNSWKNPLGYKGNFILDFDGLKFRHFAQFESKCKVGATEILHVFSVFSLFAQQQ